MKDLLYFLKKKLEENKIFTLEFMNFYRWLRERMFRDEIRANLFK